MSAKPTPRRKSPRPSRPPKSVRAHGLRLASRIDIARSLPVALARACHPKQALLTAAVVAVAAALTGRPSAQVLLVFVTVLTGQVILGWHNDLIDVQRDRRHQRDDKPIATGLVEHGQVWFALACAVLLVVPLSVANGTVAGATHLLLLGVALLSNTNPLRVTPLSGLLWTISFALWPAFLTYGGAPGSSDGQPPSIVITILAALLGLGVHVLTSLPGLVADNSDGIGHFPLALALRTGAPRLLLVTSVYLGVISVLIVTTGLTLGVAR